MHGATGGQSRRRPPFVNVLVIENEVAIEDYQERARVDSSADLPAWIIQDRPDAGRILAQTGSSYDN